MNLFKLFQLNRHGDFREVVCSSALSYLLDPNADHGLGPAFLEAFLTSAGLAEAVPAAADTVELTPEFGKFGVPNLPGRIDILIEAPRVLVGIEVKIHDRSAQDEDSPDAQLPAYAGALQAMAGKAGKDWFLVFLVPGGETRISDHAFQVVQRLYPARTRKMVWTDADASREDSVEAILRRVLADPPEACLPFTWQLMRDFVVFARELKEAFKEPGTFPVEEDVQALPTWPLFQFFRGKAIPWFSSRHTCMGIGAHHDGGAPGTSRYENSAYRVRFCKRYYLRMEEKAANLPREALEIEVYEDIANTEFFRDHFPEKFGDAGFTTSAGFHLDKYSLDSSGTQPNRVLVISVPQGTGIHQLERLHAFLLAAYRAHEGLTA
jgi:hypothetical protein